MPTVDERYANTLGFEFLPLGKPSVSGRPDREDLLPDRVVQLSRLPVEHRRTAGWPPVSVRSKDDNVLASICFPSTSPSTRLWREFHRPRKDVASSPSACQKATSERERSTFGLKCLVDMFQSLDDCLEAPGKILGFECVSSVNR